MKNVFDSKVREKSRSLFVKIASSRPLMDLWKSAYLRRKIVVLMYHEISCNANDIDAWTVVRQSDFRCQMEFLRRHFEVVSLDRALEWMAAPYEKGERLAVVTFDDGYFGNRSAMLPVVEDLGIPVTVFVATEAVQQQKLYWFDRVITALQTDRSRDVAIDLRPFQLEQYVLSSSMFGERRWAIVQRVLEHLKALPSVVRTEAVGSILRQTSICEIVPQGNRLPLSPLTVEELQEISLSPYVTIGAHSHCHSILVQLKAEDLRQSIGRSKALLELWTNRPIRHFAYPNGDFDGMVVETLKELGFVCSLTTASKPWSTNTPFFEIPRIGIGRYDSMNIFKTKVSGVRI